MAGGSGAAGARYRAFISYSHRDAVFAARLHRRLEGYALPKRLGTDRRLTPIFKDREELPAAHDLSAQVRSALAVSDCLVVVCSPDAAASPWVGREIELFRGLHPDRPILAALIRGEPLEAFPPALSAGGADPLAADFRKEADGDRLALLKLVAGIAGVGVDHLVQRDAQRRLRGVMVVTAASVAGMLAMGGMTAFALTASAEAARQRGEAEGLVEFMLTDLRGRLEEVGRLDVMTAANRRALRYFEKQDVERLPAGSRLLYARLLLDAGADLSSRNEFSAALSRFEEAHKITEVLLADKPGDPERIWTHAQSVYWIGYLNYRRGHAAQAREAWANYAGLARRFAALRPRDAEAVREVAFAEGNLCTLAVELERDATSALKFCQASVKAMTAAAALEPASTDGVIRVANRRGWLADAKELSGDLAGAKGERLQQEAMLDTVLRADPRNQKARDNWVGSQRALARIAFRGHDRREAKRRIVIARDGLIQMTRLDPDNQLWRTYLARAERDMAIITNQP